MTGPSAPRVTSVCIVHELLPDPGQDPDRTAIDKREVAGPIPVGPLGLAQDVQCDRRNHGGVDKAVYAYADEDAVWWAAELGRPVPPGLFGENLRTTGVDVTGAEIGERWRIGTGSEPLEVEVTMPRTPCVTFQRHLDEPHWTARFTAHGAPGAYLRVIRAGTVVAGDPVAVVHRPGHGVRVGDCFGRPEPAAMRCLLDAADSGSIDLAASMRRAAERALGKG